MKRVLVVCVSMFLASCATQKTMVATGGSRADGTVQLAYQFGGFEIPHVDYAAALSTASQRCIAWGYTGAEKFGGEESTCVQWNAYGCLTTKVAVNYACIGATKP